MTKKILSFTSIRSDYDLMSSLYRLLQDDPDVDLKLLVSGAHMSYTYGHTVDLIELDGFSILQKFETLLDSNTCMARVKSAAVLLQNSVDVVAHYKPDLIIYAGDREDTLVAATLSGYLGIPSVHFYGGDHAADGYIDNPVRHAVSKLSTVHMVTLDQHRARLIGMGESPERVHVIGNMSLDNIVKKAPASIESIKEKYGIGDSFDSAALVIFHPSSAELEHCQSQFENILLNLKEEGIFGFVSYPNVDPGNKGIIEVCNRYEKDDNYCFYRNLSRDDFLSIYSACTFIIGNSSSGVLESATIQIPAINVGIRQTGRLAPENVLFCKGDYSSIRSAILQAISPEFKSKVKKIRNPYGDGNSARRAYEIIRDNDFLDLLAKKEDPLIN